MRISGEAAGAALAVAEVPLYFECGWQAAFANPAPDRGRTPPPPLRLQRIMANRGWSEEKAAALEAWQWPEARKEAACDLLGGQRFAGRRWKMRPRIWLAA